jgi:hypothetical protein
MSWFGSAVSIKDGSNLDAFSRLRVSEPVGLFSVQCQYNASGLQMEIGNTGTGTLPAHSAATRMVALVTAASAGTSFIQSFEYVPYQPGKSQLAFVTGLLGAGAAGATVDVGLFDAANGIFLRQNGTSGLQIIRRTSTSGSVVNNAVDQTSWNIDKLDGTGISGHTLNPLGVFILVIDAQFLGMGRVRVGFDIDGNVHYCHEFLNAGVLAVPYMQTLSLPVQMLVTATTAAKTAYFKCATVISEGGFAEDLGFNFATPPVATTAASGADTAMISLRPATTFNSLANRQRLVLDSVDIIAGSNPISWKLILGATFSAGPTWAAVNATYSGSEYTSAPGTISTQPLVVASGFLPGAATARGTVSASQKRIKYPITLDRAGAQRAMGTITLICSGIGGTSACQVSMNYTEIR